MSIKDKILRAINKAPTNDNSYNPFGLHIGSTVEIDTLKVRANDQLKIKCPDTLLKIVAYGKITVDHVNVHRYYTDNNTMLEVITKGEQVIDEVRLFTPFDTVYPQSEADWDFWVGKDGYIGHPNFVITDQDDGTEVGFQRFWSDDTEHPVEPIDLEENLTANTTGNSSFIEHRCMMYARDADRTPEYALVSAEDTGTETYVEIMLGIELSETEFEVFHE